MFIIVVIMTETLSQGRSYIKGDDHVVLRCYRYIVLCRVWAWCNKIASLHYEVYCEVHRKINYNLQISLEYYYNFHYNHYERSQ